MAKFRPNLGEKAAWAALAAAFFFSCPLTAFQQGGDAPQPKGEMLQLKDPLMLRNISLSSDRIAFSFAGDIWTVPRQGGQAERLTEDAAEEVMPAFSPDGSRIAFTRVLGGNHDVFVMPSQGGQASRLTYYPKLDWPVSWTPDGSQVLFMSTRDMDGLNRLYRISAQGGFPQPLPLPSGYQGSLSPDQGRLAYLPYSRSFLFRDSWRYYRGGSAAPLWIADLATSEVEQVSDGSFNVRYPMWIGEKIYYLSDQSGIFNLYVRDLKTGESRQLSSFQHYGARHAAAAEDAIALLRHGRVLLFDLTSEKMKQVPIRLSVAAPQLKARTVDAAGFIQSVGLSHTADRLIFGARGKILTFDPQSLQAANHSGTSGVAEREPQLSPDGKWIASFSDRSGEYQLEIRPAQGGQPVGSIAIEENPSFYWDLQWSPDSSRIVFTDARLGLWLADLESGKADRIDVSTYIAQGSFATDWSPDGRYMAYSKALENRLRTIFVYDTDKGRSHQLTAGDVQAEFPVFDRSGKYLYFAASDNAHRAAASDIGWGLLSTQLARPLVYKTLQAVVLRQGDPAPFVPTVRRAHPSKPWTEATPRTRIDFEGIRERIITIPIDPHDFTDLEAGPAGTLFARSANWPDAPGAARSRLTPLYRIQLEQPGNLEEFIADVDEFVLSGDGRRILYRNGSQWRMAETPAAKPEGVEPLDLSNLKVEIDPAQEWRQMYREAWRQMRDYFYDPNHHGQDLAELEKHYAALLPSVTRRSDLNMLFSEMLGHVSVSHLRVGGGDDPSPRGQNSRVGVLGADYEIDQGRYRFAKIYQSAHYTTLNPLLRAPLGLPGTDVHEGDFLLQVDGQELTAQQNIYSLFEGKAFRPVEIVVSADVQGSNARKVTVVPHNGAGSLRLHNWAKERHEMVERLSGGRLAYAYVANYGMPGGISELYRVMIASQDKEGLIIDQRFNGGGTTSDTLIEALQRRPLYYYAYRHGNDFPVHPVTFPGPSVLIAHQGNFSAAETFAHMYKLAKVGTIVGKRTGGGGIGAALFQPTLIDGGRIGIPNRAAYNPGGSWDIENYGVTPHVEVEILPKDWRAGRDPQIETAVRIALQEAKNFEKPEKVLPTYPVHPRD